MFNGLKYFEGYFLKSLGVLFEKFVVVWNNESLISVIVGVMVSGLIKWSRNLIKLEKLIRIWNRVVIMIVFWICKSK